MSMACTMAGLGKSGKLPFKANFQQLGKYFCTPIMKSSQSQQFVMYNDLFSLVYGDLASASRRV